MSPDNFQRYVDQHPALFAAIFPIYFISLWLLVAVIISYTGGWHSLSKIYRTQVPFHGAKWGGQSGQMRRMTNYNRVFTMGASQEGLYLLHVSLPVHAPASADSVERDQGAKEEGLGVRLRHSHVGARTDDPPADSFEDCRTTAE